jgi:hypothetical protein
MFDRQSLLPILSAFETRSFKTRHEPRLLKVWDRPSLIF